MIFFFILLYYLNTEEKIYRSEDTSVDNEMDIQNVGSIQLYRQSFSIPLHLLKLKVGAAVMRNIYPLP